VPSRGREKANSDRKCSDIDRRNCRQLGANSKQCNLPVQSMRCVIYTTLFAILARAFVSTGNEDPNFHNLHYGDDQKRG
jgi:hypothetical protein